MKPGIYDNISPEAYQDDPCETPSLSASLCKVLVNETPLHAWTAHPRFNPNFEREEKEVFDLGTTAHALMLQGLQVAQVIQATNKEGGVVSDYKTKGAQQERDSIRAAGGIPILQKHWDRVQAMVKAGKEQIAAHREAKDAFTDGKAEQTLVWVDDYGVTCRARLDWLMDSHARIYDYKTTGATADPYNMGKFIASQNWDLQAAFYLRGLKKLTDKDAEFFFVCQEDYVPHALSILGLSQEFLILGTKKVQWGLQKFADCMNSGKWPGYPDRIVDPPFPVWEAERFALKEMR